MRIAFITDTHLGGTAEGFQQQPRWVGGLGVLMDRLKKWMDAQRVDVLIHGGDVVDHGTADEIRQGCAMLAALDRPVIVCMGNHDLMTEASWEYWQREYPRHARLALARRELGTDTCDVLALNNHWIVAGEQRMFWDGQKPVPCLTASQLEDVAAWLARDALRPAIVVAHAPITALPPELTGKESPMEDVPLEYARALGAVLQGARRPVLLLGGHCHVTYARRAGAWLTTTSAFGEPPFQVRLIEVGQGRIRMTTHSLAHGNEPVQMDPGKRWTAGRSCDCQVQI